MNTTVLYLLYTITCETELFKNSTEYFYGKDSIVNQENIFISEL